MTKFKEVAHLYMGVRGTATTIMSFDTKLVAYNGSNDLKNGIPFDQIEDYKFVPSLFPLSAMTEEQQIRLGLIIRNIKPENASHADKIFALDDSPHFAIKKGMKCTLSLAQCVEITNYLRSEYLDVDNLIESGEAIDVTTLKINPYEK